MRILVACEESQRVCIAPLLNGNCTFRTCDSTVHTIDKWDMIIAFPPCTYLTKAGSCNLYRGGELNEERFTAGQQAAQFFRKIYEADCPRICIENPIPMGVFDLPPHSQEIQPFYFGVPVSKMTYLWLKGLPFLCPTKVIKPQYTFNNYPLFKNSFGKYRQKNRSKTFKEVAAAMALSWG